MKVRAAKTRLAILAALVLILIAAVFVAAVQETYFAGGTKTDAAQSEVLPVFTPAAFKAGPQASQSDEPVQQNEPAQSDHAVAQDDFRTSYDYLQWEKRATDLRELITETNALLDTAWAQGGRALDQDATLDSIAAAEEVLANEPSASWTKEDYRAALEALDWARIQMYQARSNSRIVL